MGCVASNRGYRFPQKLAHDTSPLGLEAEHLGVAWDGPAHHPARLLFLHHLPGTVDSSDRIRHQGLMAMTSLPARRNAGRYVEVLTAATLAMLLVAAGTAAAQMVDDIIVKYDQSQLLRLPQPAAEIIIGNPVIADVAVQSGGVLVVTGKSFGITNMIVLDAKRDVILERRIMVRREDARVVNLLRGSQRQTFNCTPQCNPTVTIGDEPAYFDATLKAAEKKAGMSEKAADGTQGGN